MLETSTVRDENWCRPPLEAYYLTGPTASGKTPMALELAQRIQAEIVSLDSMAIYRGMDIGTAKPTGEDRLRVPHHLLDIVDPNESFSVSCYADNAHRVAAEIAQRGKRVLFVGGTPLYLKSLLRGFFLGPPSNPDFRKAVEADVAQHGLASLRERLEQVDPLLAHKLHPNDQRRMIRGLEVAMATGRPLSHWQTQFDTPAINPQIRAAVVGIDRAWLHQRINHRTDRMLNAGLEDEVRALLDRFEGKMGTAAQAVGYREMIAYVQGKRSWEDTVLDIKAHTRQFARRQEIWFRSLKELRRFELTPESSVPELAERIAGWFQTGSILHQ